jgi:hypothetical protein
VSKSFFLLPLLVIVGWGSAVKAETTMVFGTGHSTNFSEGQIVINNQAIGNGVRTETISQVVVTPQPGGVAVVNQQTFTSEIFGSKEEAKGVIESTEAGGSLTTFSSFGTNP